jgi:ABC-2 type transport system permease protein
MLLSGFTFPIDQMAVGIRPITLIVAARYYIIILKGVFLRGNGLRILAVPALALSIYTVIMVLLAKRSFHKSLD